MTRSLFFSVLLLSITGSLIASDDRHPTEDRKSAIGTCDSGFNIDVESSGGTLLSGYETLGSAVAAINAGAHSGTITIELCSDTVESGTITLLGSGQGVASYSSIDIYPLSDNVTISSSQASGFGIIQLKGVDNFTLNGDNPNTVGTNRDLTIWSTSDAAVDLTAIVRITTVGTVAPTANNITIKNTVLTGNVTGRNGPAFNNTSGPENRTFGIYVGGNGGSTATDLPIALTSVTGHRLPTGTTVNSLGVENNLINAVARGVVFSGTAATNSTGIIIANNEIGAAGELIGTPPYVEPATTVYVKGIIVNGTNAVSITGNKVRNIISYVPTPIVGIELNGLIGSGVINIEGNQLDGIVLNAPSPNPARGISLINTVGAYSVKRNAIKNVQNFCNNAGATNQPNGIYAESFSTSGTISSNVVEKVYDNSVSTRGVAGIFLNGGSNVIVENNLVTDINQNISFGNAFSTSWGTIGIRIGAGRDHKIISNTVSLSGDQLGNLQVSKVLSAALAVVNSSSTGLEVKNNILSNELHGGIGEVAHVSIYLPSDGLASLNLTLNNNDYSVGDNPTQHGILQAGGTPGTNFFTASNFDPSTTTPVTNLRAFTSALNDLGTNDNSSMTVDPGFVSEVDLHLGPMSPLLGRAAPTGLDRDADGDPRGSIADIGADEVVEASNGVFPGGQYHNALINGPHSLAGDVTISHSLFLNGKLSTGGFTLSLGCEGEITGYSEGEANMSYIEGRLEKAFCRNGVFNYPVGAMASQKGLMEGARSGYSPVRVTVTGGQFPASLRVQTADSFMPPLQPARSLSRMWILTETGDLMADLEFTYRQEDVNGNEADYRLYHQNSQSMANMCPVTACVNTAANVLQVAGVTQFASWGAGENVLSSVNASISGRVTTASGAGIRNALVMLSGGDLPQPVRIFTGSLGNYVFENLRTGDTYLIQVGAKRYRMSQSSRMVTLQEDITDLDFVANPQL